MIKSINFNQQEILEDIIKLHCPQGIEADATFSKGIFYKGKPNLLPKLKFDLFPQTEDTIKSAAEALPLKENSIKSLIFDPPFCVGYTTGRKTGIIGERFNGFRYIKDLWEWYYLCIKEFYRVLQKGGVLIIKCQDTVSSGRQYLSHNYIIQTAERQGFYTKDLFILLAKSRLIGHNHSKQKHARKFHSYFLVFEKDKTIK